jgi:two-component sensor histidine kinase
VASVSDLARQYTDVTGAERAHLRRLVGSWGPLADLSFSDLQLMAPVGHRVPGADVVILGHVRPATAQTLFNDDQVGRLARLSDHPVVAAAFETGAIEEAEAEADHVGPVSNAAIPVTFEGRVIAVVARNRRRFPDRTPSELELSYMQAFDRVAHMILEGTFPFPFEDALTEEAPRVVDGVVLLTRTGEVTYLSPNAVSALHRAGFHGPSVGRKLEDLGFDAALIDSAYQLQVPVVQELERGEDVAILARLLPFVERGSVTGGLVLLRDVSDLRRRDRMLVSMDATIREIHHRVKNNLQTVSSLLRLQGRRVDHPEAKMAIDESVRRIASIAVVHEMLAVKGGDEVAFADVVRPIMNEAERQQVREDQRIRIRLLGDGPSLPAHTASSLAVVINELIQNAIEHGFPPGSPGGAVLVELITAPTELRVRVHDDGVGVPEGFDPATSDGLGLTIISTLVSGELAGELFIRPATAPQRGTVAEVRVRLATDDE